MKDLDEIEKVFLEKMVESTPLKRGGYIIFQKEINGKRFRIKRSRAVMQIYLNKKLESWEIVHHKDGNKQNDNIENLEIIDTKDFNIHISNHHLGRKKPGSGNKEHKTKKEVINRAREISQDMIKVNYSEISRRLEKEGIKISSLTLKRHICK